MKDTRDQRQGAPRRFPRGWGGALLWALVISAVLRAGAVQASWVPSGSMEPTLLPGDHMLVNKLCYDLID